MPKSRYQTVVVYIPDHETPYFKMAMTPAFEDDEDCKYTWDAIITRDENGTIQSRSRNGLLEIWYPPPTIQDVLTSTELKYVRYHQNGSIEVRTASWGSYYYGPIVELDSD